MRFIDLFAGIGGFRRGLELSGHECVGFCEIDKYAQASYRSMHLLTERERERLREMPMNQRRDEILKEKYTHGEWYEWDIKTIDSRRLPRADLWTFGSPCQDFSKAGLRHGLRGNRSSLIRSVFDLLGQIDLEHRPRWLIYENVKGMLSANGGRDFLAILMELDRLGYDVEWENLNSRHYGVPQNRERIYTVGHLRGQCASKVFPLEGADVQNHIPIKLIGHNADYRRNRLTYDPSGTIEALDTMRGGGREPCVIDIIGSLDPNRHSQMDVMSDRGISPTIDTMHEPKKIAVQVIGGIGEMTSNGGTQFFQQDRIYDGDQIATSLTGQLTKGSNMYSVKPHEGIDTVYYPKGDCQIAIRRLTPKECFRLQGWTDEYFERARSVNSESQLYKQAGNGVTVSVVEAIGRRLKECEE